MIKNHAAIPPLKTAMLSVRSEPLNPCVILDGLIRTESWDMPCSLLAFFRLQQRIILKKLSE